MTEPFVRPLPEAPDLPYRLGRSVHHDPRSRAFAFDVDTAPVLQSVYWPRAVPIFDQGNLGSCFPGDVRVRMADGSERPIGDVRLGERVVTAEGGTGRVTRTMLRDEDGGLLNLRLWGHAHLRMTREHPVLTARGYVKAHDLHIGDEVALPRYVAEQPTVSIAPRDLVRRHRLGSVELPEKIELTTALGRLFGLWLAEGSADGTKVRWTYGGHEDDTLVPETVQLCADALGQQAHAARRPNGTWWVTLYGTPWNALFKLLGGERGDTKRPHASLCSGPVDFLRAMLDGWLAGDGCYRKDGSAEGVTISADLALAMFDIAQTLGRHPVIDYRESPQNAAAVHRRPKWTLTMSPGPGRCRQDERHVWRKVRELAIEDYVGPVYDLTIEGDHSYVAEGIGVHNCTGNAAAGWLATTNALRPGMTICPLPDFSPFGDPIGVRYTGVNEALAVDIYGQATAIDPFPGAYPPEDTGSDGLSVTKVLKEWGVVDTYQHAFSVSAVLAALMTGPVLVGTAWHQGMFDPDEWGVVTISGPVVGGHEYLLVGYDATREQVTFANSWGTGWADAGYGHMTVATLAALLADDGDATIPHAVVAAPAPDPGAAPFPVVLDPDVAAHVVRLAARRRITPSAWVNDRLRKYFD